MTSIHTDLGKAGDPLALIGRRLTDTDHGRIVVSAVLDIKQITTDADSGAVEPKLRLRAVCPILDPAGIASALRTLDPRRCAGADDPVGVYDGGGWVLDESGVLVRRPVAPPASLFDDDDIEPEGPRLIGPSDLPDGDIVVDAEIEEDDGDESADSPLDNPFSDLGGGAS